MPKRLALRQSTFLPACAGLSPITPRSFANPQGTSPPGSYDPLEDGDLPPVVVALEVTRPAKIAVDGWVVAVDRDGDVMTLARTVDVTAGTLDFDDAAGDDGSRVVLADGVSGLIDRHVGSGAGHDSLTGPASPGSPWIAADGARWLPDTVNRAVLAYPAGSTVPLRIGRTDRTAGTALGEFDSAGAADDRASDTRVWILGAGKARVLAATSAPSVVTATSIAGLGAGAAPCRGIAIGSDGEIYVARFSGAGTPAIPGLAADGTLFDTRALSTLPGGGAGCGPTDLAGTDVDPTGRLALSAPLDMAIHGFAP